MTKTLNQRLFDALKSGEVIATEEGRYAQEKGLFWGDLSLKVALDSGYVEYSDEAQALEDANADEFKKLVNAPH